MDAVSEGPLGENPFNSPHKASSISGTPLQCLSPERLNQRIPASPSLPSRLDQHGSRHQHRLSDASDVKARVAYLNSMNGSPTRSSSPTKPYHHASSHAAIQRAIVGREEAETALNAMMAQLESAKSRERLVAERVESLMEQLQEARSRQRHERQVYEKEMKLSKKNEYKAELAVIKLQEELKEVKNELEAYRARAEHDKSEKEKARQESFERAYVVAGMTEELQTLKDQLQVVEQERDHAVATAASKMPTEESKRRPEGVDRAVNTEPSEFEPREQPQPPLQQWPCRTYTLEELDTAFDEGSPLEKKYAYLQLVIKQLERELKEEREVIHFMNMQCQFMACPCRTAEREGYRFVHDHAYDRKMQEQNSKKRKIEDLKPVARYKPGIAKIWAKYCEDRKAYEAQQQAAEQPPQAMDVDSKEAQPAEEINTSSKTFVDQNAPLPPAELDIDDSRLSGQVDEASEAALIPLPTSGEDTAQLEDFTQVMVDPVPITQDFNVTASTSKQGLSMNQVPKLSQSQSNIDMSEELFNLSPPKRAPPRPSTAMGIVSVDSPVRLVPQSPRSRTPGIDLPQMYAHPQTTRVALNDTSSHQQPRGQRSRSRPGIRTQSRGRSPIAQTVDSRPVSALEMNSPASSTIFPITPVPKHPRGQVMREDLVEGRRHRQYEISSQQQTYPAHLQSETTTTTTIPLRGDDDASESSSYQYPVSSAPPTSAVFLQDAHGVPGTPITREAALAQIRARRDRARSVNMRKAEQDSHPDGERRGMKTPGSAARRGVKIDLGNRLGLSQRERGRDVSQASAPGRI